MAILKARRRGCFFVLVVLISIIAIITLFRKIDLTTPEFFEVEKCPFCFGEDLCPKFYNGDFRITDLRSKYGRIFNVKNVHFAEMRTRNVILKKLAHDSEWRESENRICHSFANLPRSKCHPGLSLRSLTNDLTIFSNTEKRLDPNLGSFSPPLEEGTEILSCLSSSGPELLTWLLRRTKFDLSFFLTMILINPEPIILRAFPASEGWPFPTYFGSCGRVTVVENVGNELLSNFYGAPFSIRVRLASQLLELAFRLSENSIKLYLTDWSTDNFVVNERTLRLSLIDLENIILVNGSSLSPKIPSWNVNHTSTGYGCNDCFSYSVDDLCTHKRSDHNLYGACQGILAPEAYSRDMPNGLLHTIPAKIENRHPLFRRLIQECGKPSHPGGRYEAAKQLLDILKQL